MTLNNGYYESVINKLIFEEIENIQSDDGRYIDTKKIDEEEGKSVLSKYMSIIINKSLNRISGANKRDRQVEVCNKIINLLIQELELEDFSDFVISENSLN